MVVAVAGSILTAAEHPPRHPGNCKHFEGFNKCVHSKHFFPALSWLQAWRLCRQPRHRSMFPSAFNPSALTATTGMRPINARLWATTAQATSTTASFWGWGPGAAGAIATAGAGTASATTAAGAITAAAAIAPMPGLAAADLRRGQAANPCAVVADKPCAVAADGPWRRQLMHHQRVAVAAVVKRTLAAAAVKCTAAVVADMQVAAVEAMPAVVVEPMQVVAADTGNRSRRSRTAKGGANQLRRLASERKWKVQVARSASQS